MKTVKYELAKKLLREGDVLLYGGQSGIIGKLIKRAGEGKYSHVGVASQTRNIWECVEFRERIGGRSSSLERQVELYNGIDVYRPIDTLRKSVYNEKTNEVVDKYILFDAYCVTSTMRKMTGLPYGLKRILWIACHKLPFLRMFYDISSVIDDDKKEIIYPVCSTAVAYSFNKCGVDLIPQRADNWTEPNDIARSGLLSYLFTLSK